MNANSFRLKIALLSGAISGGLLILMAVVFWRITYETDLGRIDHELRNLGSPQLDRVNGGEHWTRFENALGFVSTHEGKPSFILWVKNGNRVLHKSGHWPTEIDPEGFPLPSSYEGSVTVDPNNPPPAPRRSEGISRGNPPLPRKEPVFYTRHAGGKTWRIAVMGNPYMTLILGADLGEFMTGMDKLRRAYLAAMPVVLLLVAAGAWLLANRALRPVSLLTQTVERVSAKGLDQRLPERDFDQEFKRLVTVFNEMMNRLETSFHQATRFSADAAHELKTPLAILQGELEQAIQSAPDGSEYQRTCTALIEEIQRLKSIVEKLLLLSVVDAGRLQLDLARVNLSTLLQETMEDVAVLAPGTKVESEIALEVFVQADPALLHQVLQNLGANAAKYTQPGGQIRFTLDQRNGHASLRVANTGAGISDEDREHVFERFHRGDASRSKRTEGTGLGLSLAREIIRAHDGELCLAFSDAQWTQFELTLPVHKT